MAKTIVGLDIGHGVLRAAEVSSPSGARPTLVAYHESPVPIEAVYDGEVVDADVVSNALRELWKRARFGTKDVVLGMGNQRVLSRDHKVPEAPIDRIRESLPFQVQDLLPVPVSEAILDFYPIAREMTEEGPMVQGLLVAAVRSAVLGNVDAVEKSGLHVAEVDLIPFALTRLLGGAVTHGLTAFIDIGASTTTVVLASGTTPHFVRVVPTGGRDLTGAIVAAHGMPYETAERIKCQVGVVPQVFTAEQRPIIETLLSATTDLVGSVRSTLSYYASLHPELPITNLVLSGGGAEMPGIREAFGELVRVPVALADPFSRISVNRRIDGEHLRRTAGRVPVAVGLAVGSKA
jgi:type IV pilus assembly protein PilM